MFNTQSTDHGDPRSGADNMRGDDLLYLHITTHLLPDGHAVVSVSPRLLSLAAGQCGV